MADTDENVVREPPVAGDETSTLVGSLERQRATFAWKCSGLDVPGEVAKDGGAEPLVSRTDCASVKPAQRVRFCSSGRVFGGESGIRTHETHEVAYQLFRTRADLRDVASSPELWR